MFATDTIAIVGWVSR